MKEAHSLSDIQRFYIVMAPTSRKGAPLRLAAVGKKQLPQLKGRFWACIQGISDKVPAIFSHTFPQEQHLSLLSRRCSQDSAGRRLSAYALHCRSASSQIPRGQVRSSLQACKSLLKQTFHPERITRQG